MQDATHETKTERTRLSLAVGLLEEISHLEGIIGEFALRRIDLEAARLIAASESTVFSDEQTAQIKSHLAVQRIPMSTLTVERMWTDVICPIARTHSEKPDHSQAAHWAMPAALTRQNQRLYDHLKEGRGVFVAAIKDEAQQQIVASVLLGRASAVFTHQAGTRSIRQGAAAGRPLLAPRLQAKGQVKAGCGALAGYRT